MIGTVIDGQVEPMGENCSALTMARGGAHVLDDATVERVVRVYGEALDMAPVLEEQLTRWRLTSLTPTQRAEVERLTGEMVRYRELCGRILALAEDLKPYTIETVMGMPDEQAGVAHLMELAAASLDLPPEVTTARRIGPKGEPALRFTHQTLGLLGYVFVTAAADGGVDVAASVADREVAPEVAARRLAIFAPLAERFVKLVADQVRALGQE